MLIQFNFSNFKSYRNEASLDMIAASIKEHQDNLIEGPKGERYLKTAAIYGANASGKTAVIQAFDFMRYFVLNSFKLKDERKGIPVKPFAFDKSGKNAKSEFEVFFIHNGQEYQYGFVVDTKRVHQEWLYKRDLRAKKRYKTLFERDVNRIECGQDFKGAEVFANLVDDEVLFLSFVSNAKVREAKNVTRWFQNTKVVNFGDAWLETLMSMVLPVKAHDDQAALRRLEAFLKAVDVGIDGIRVEKVKSGKDDEDHFRVYALHKLYDGSGYVEIPFTEESSGTQKLFCLYGFLRECLDGGHTLFVDELDAKLHPLLLRYIVDLFHNPDTNPKQAQLIFTTHNTFILTRDIFRRDQIWFADKDDRGVSSLYSLVEFKLHDNKKVRNDATYYKDYLAGRYGAVPLLKEFNIVEE